MKSLLHQLVILLLAAAIPASASAWFQWKRGKWDSFRDHSVPLSEIPQWKQPVLWVDARTVADFSKQHVPGAMRLTEDNWTELLPELLKIWEPGCKMVVYCNGNRCHASKDVAKRLREEVGLKNVYVLRGGWDAWKGARR